MSPMRATLAAGLTLVSGSLAAAQETTRVSVDSSGAQANSYSRLPTLSADGQFVAFFSYASNLVAGDTNHVYDTFVHDRSTGVTERVSVDSSGAQGDGDSYEASFSSDGRFVAFWSGATNLVAGDTMFWTDVFVHDRSTGITERVSVDSSGQQANNFSGYPTISADGRYVAFWSRASNLVAGDTNGCSDAFVHDRSTGVTERVSIDSSGAEGNGEAGGANIVAGGQIVLFYSAASNLISGDTNGYADLFVHDRSTGVTEIVDVDSSGVQANLGAADEGFGSHISADGLTVTFSSDSTNLVAGDTNGRGDVFVHDRSTGITERVSLNSSGAEGNGLSWYSSISSDGRIVTFQSDASNLVGGDTNSITDVFAHDRTTGITERVTVDSSGAQANAQSRYPALSADGQVVAFESTATNLVAGDTNGDDDAFVHERCSIDASWSNYGAGFPGTNGVPTFTAQSNPGLGTTLTLDLGNSSGNATTALLLLGFQRTSIHSRWGGELLVVPALTLLVALPASGASFNGNIPNDDALCGFTLDLQAFESDPGAARSVSFTQGLELVLGH